MDKCYHINFVSKFNSIYGYAYCPDCGKIPLSFRELCLSILKPGTNAIIKSIAQDILKNCPDPNCKICQDVIRIKYKNEIT